MPEVSIHRIATTDDDVLRVRLEAGKGPFSQTFVARCGGQDAGLLIFDEWPGGRLGIVHEVYVLEEYRGAQIGQLLLSHAETTARAVSLEMLQLRVRSLDPEHMDDQQLIGWYTRNGYLPDDSERTLLRKSLG